MNWEQIAGNWKQFKSSLRQRWGRFTDNDLEQIAGNRDKLLGMLQERYGMAKEEAEREGEEWARSLQTGEASRRRGAA